MSEPPYAYARAPAGARAEVCGNLCFSIGREVVLPHGVDERFMRED